MKWMSCLAVLGVALAEESSGLSWDAGRGSPDSTYAQCLNGDSCTDITSGKYASSCLDAAFTPKQ